MKSKFKHIESIIKYTSGRMGSPERAWFEKELKINKRLSDEYREYIILFGAIQDHEAIKFRKQLTRIFTPKNRHNQKNDPIKISRKKIIPYAAIFAIFIILGIGIFIEVYITNLTQKWVLSIPVNDSIIFISDSSLSNPLRATVKNINDSANLDRINLYSQIDCATEDSINFADILKEFPGDNYRLDLVLSELISSSYRSANFKVLEPTDSSVYKQNDMILLRWVYGKTDFLFLEILDNKGKIKFEAALDSTDHYNLNNTFTPGIYIIKFRTNNDLLDMRVFYVF